MLKYLAIRLLGLIPLLFLITLLGFGYSALFPLSNERLLNEELTPESEDNKVNIRKQKALVDYYKLNIPLFYFEIRSLAEKGGPAHISSPTERRMFRKLCLASGQGAAVKRFRDTIIDLEDQLQGQDSSSAFLIELRLLRQRPFQSISYSLNKLATISAEQAQPVLSAYEDIYSTSAPWKAGIPTILSHGLNNRYHLWLGSILSGFDWGKSYKSSSITSVTERLGYYMPWTLSISLLSILIALVVSIPLGVWMALKANSWKDKGLRNLLFFLDGVPRFWLAIIMLKLFTNPDFLHLSNSEYANAVPMEGESMFHLILRMIPFMAIPLFAYSYGYIIYLSRMVRASLLDVLSQEFLLSAKVRGVPNKKLIWKYALKNALLPVITVSGAFIPSLVSGSVILERIFSINGMGEETLRAVFEFDVPVLLGILVLSATLTLLGYLISDLISMWVDPRVRFDL